MEQPALHVLVVDDDPSILEVFERSFQSENHNISTASSIKEARSITQFKSFNLIFIDCMLPDGNGVQLASELKPLFNDATMFLMSGVFKDNAFRKDSLEKSGASNFLAKPFQIELLLQTIAMLPLTDISGRRSPFYSIKHENKTKQERIDFLDQIAQTHSLEIPFLLNELAELKWNGEIQLFTDSSLQLKLAVQDSNLGLNFSNNTEDRIYNNIKKMIIDHSYLNEDKNLLDIVFHQCLASPHQISEVYSKDLQHLLKELVTTPKNYKLKLVPGNQKNNSTLPIQLLNENLSSFYQFGTSILEIKKVLDPYYDSYIKLSSSSPNFSQIELYPLIGKLASTGLIKELDGRQKLINLEEKYTDQSNDFFRAIFFLASLGCLKFIQSEQKEQINKIYTTTQRYHKTIVGAQPEDIFTHLGVSPRMRKSEIEQKYKDFCKVNHPDLMPSDAPDELKKMNHELFSAITEAYSIMTNDEKKTDYFNKKKMNAAEETIKADNLRDEAYNLIQRRSYTKAIDNLNKSLKIMDDGDTHLLLIWAKLKSSPQKGVALSKTELDSMYNTLLTLPKKQKDSAIYALVYSLYLKEVSQFKDAYVQLKLALKRDPNLLEARRELIDLKNRSTKMKGKSSEGSIFTQDLTSIFKNIWNK